MSETTSIPTLTLDPNGTQAAAQAAALEEEIKAAAEKAQNPVEKVEIEKLSPEEQAAVKEFSSQIDVTNTEQVMNYGAAAQKNISEFSDAALSIVKRDNQIPVNKEDLSAENKTSPYQLLPDGYYYDPDTGEILGE